MTRDGLIAILRDVDPVASAAALDVDRSSPVTWTRTPPPPEWFVDGDDERPVAEHRRASLEGRPSEASVAYGTRVPAERTADRLLDLASLHAETGLLRAVCPTPAEGSPGSWGVQDLAAVVAARLALPDVAWVRPSWTRLGAALCQVAVAFGANDWVLPEGDRSDPEHLARAVGRRAVQR
ncbi:MAG: hypothetical protein HYX33_01740 [Actinobacteria bacterium]|nr:hypothetical protein [Actinomycetota bacterium]